MPLLRSRDVPTTGYQLCKQKPVSKFKSFAQSRRSDPTRVAKNSPSHAANIVPAEILLQIYSLLTPRDFDNARHTCSQWMRVSLNRSLLNGMLRRAGWWDAWQQDCARERALASSTHESEVWRMSKRLATECLLSGRKANAGTSRFVKTQFVDFSGLSPGKSKPIIRGTRSQSSTTSIFSVSSCNNYLLVARGCIIYVFRLLGKTSNPAVMESLESCDLVLISSISCSFEVLSVTMNTSTPNFTVAALLRNRVTMICDLKVPEYTNNVSPSTAGSNSSSSRSSTSPKSGLSSPHYFYDICSEAHPPRTIAICPGRRSVALGCAGGIEIHWIDEKTSQDRRKHLPMSQPSEVLHFLQTSTETPKAMRLISSLSGSDTHECACRQSPFPDHSKTCQFHKIRDVHAYNGRRIQNTSSLSLLSATHCNYHRAVPINDGHHMIFIEPRTKLLCIGSNTPIGGPASLTRAFVCVPPSGKGLSNQIHAPTIYTVGSDLDWGLRVVAAYNDRIVLYSIPVDVFNIIRKERERQSDGMMGSSDLARDWFTNSDRFSKQHESLVQNQNGDWEFLLSVSYRPMSLMWPFKIYGKEIGRVNNLVELSLQSSNGGARIWAFNSSGGATLFDIDTSSKCNVSNTSCKYVTVGSDGNLETVRFVHKVDSMPLQKSRKRKASALRDDFVGRYGISGYVPSRAQKDEEYSYSGIRSGESPIKRSSFAACIVDLRFSEVGKD